MSDAVSMDVSNFEEEDKQELQALKEEAKENMSSKNPLVCSCTSKQSLKRTPLIIPSKGLTIAPMHLVPITLALMVSLEQAQKD